MDADYYVGVGSGAFSFLDGTLYTTTFSLETYAQRIAAGLTGITTRHRLGHGDLMRYDLLMRMFGLRLDRAWALRLQWRWSLRYRGRRQRHRCSWPRFLRLIRTRRP